MKGYANGWLAAMGALVLMAIGSGAAAADLYVSPNGDDGNRGTIDHPLRTPDGARLAVRKLKKGGAPVSIYFRAGTYYLANTLVFDSADSGTKQAPITYAAYRNEPVTLSGGALLHPRWRPYRDGILVTPVPAGFDTDQLFVDGVRQQLARYPNYNPNVRILGGYAADSISKERASRWADPTGGYIHAMHSYMWGDFHYLITGKAADGSLMYEGGWQNNRKMGMHPEYRFVEGIFEELDAPGEWFLNKKEHLLYYYPPAGTDMATARVEGVRLKRLVEFRGDMKAPARFIHLRGFTFQHAARTFMENREPLLRSDWTIYRGGALFFDGAEDCGIDTCFLDQMGGNAIFVSGYNRRVTVRRTHIAEAGANGVAFVGDPKAVRNPLFEYNERQSATAIDRTPGPRTPDYPAECLVDDCLIYRTGRVEKQTAPIEIDMAQDITVRHCSLYDVPRAGINIGDGCWGGDVIEYCDIFDTVRETGDHGSFNSWGRDRYWNLDNLDLNHLSPADLSTLPLLDVVKPITLRNNRWRCDHGWDIDLDDGSSNFHIYNNLCLNGGLKMREGFYRVCENNVTVNNSLHPHVWFMDSRDVVRNNIVFTPYQPINVPKPWGQECDYNLLNRPGATGPATELQAQSGLDAHSEIGDAMFLDPAHADYRVKPDSPALKLGFHNFPMNQFGVQYPPLKAIARTPELPGGGAVADASRKPEETVWNGARVKNVNSLGEVSAAGLPGEIGVVVESVNANSPASRAGLRTGDVIRQLNGKPTDSTHDLRTLASAAQSPLHLSIWRDQRLITLPLTR